MKLKISLIAMFFLSFSSAACANTKIPDCAPILMGEVEKINNLQSKLPVVSREVDDSFSSLYKSMGVPEFYKLRYRSHYYLWLLHHDISKAKEKIRFYLSEIFADDPLSALFKIGNIAILFSNVRNAWAEYAAYSDSVPFSDTEREQISYDLSQLALYLQLYNSCLAAKVVTEK